MLILLTLVFPRRFEQALTRLHCSKSDSIRDWDFSETLRFIEFSLAANKSSADIEKWFKTRALKSLIAVFRVLDSHMWLLIMFFRLFTRLSIWEVIKFCNGWQNYYLTSAFNLIRYAFNKLTLTVSIGLFLTLEVADYSCNDNEICVQWMSSLVTAVY